jgi:hypothetical protein
LLLSPAALSSPSSKAVAPDGWPFNGKVADLIKESDRAERQQDPLRFIAGDMSGVVSKLSEYKTDKPVQQKQEEIVQSLDEIIKELEKQCKGGGKAGGGGGKPLSQSVIAGGPGGQGEMIDPKKGDKQWTTLPPKQREQILQSQTEGFPPGYEAILQSYYRRLSQEQVNPDGSTPAATPLPAGAAHPAAASPDSPAPATRPSAR